MILKFFKKLLFPNIHAYLLLITFKVFNFASLEITGWWGGSVTDASSIYKVTNYQLYLTSRVIGL